MELVFEFNTKKVFSLEEARRIGKLLYHITKKKNQRVEQLLAQLQIKIDMGQGEFAQIEDQIDREIREWEGKVERLGGVPRGLWKADLDSGSGYYCWKFPETTVDHWHGYRDGNSKRVCLSGECISPVTLSVEEENELLHLQEMK